MSDSAHNSSQTAATFEAFIERFEDEWQSGRRPDLATFVPDNLTDRARLLLELTLIDLEYRLKFGEPARVEEYLNRFRELASDENVVLELLGHEFSLRRRADSNLSVDEYRRRFPQLAAKLETLIVQGSRSRPAGRRRFAARLDCPHCHNPIEIVSDSVDEDVTCPSCGSAVHLDTGKTLTWNKQRLPQIAQFELLEAVGRGAFGTVYKARDQQLQRVVAIKVPRSGVLATDEDEDRFVREARNAAQLQHPGIVAIHSVGRSETFPYLVSEFVDGVTLSQYLTAKRFSVKDAAKLIRDIALALQHAHEQGVVHRDLKPSNIMLTPDGTPRVMDFGFAKRDAGEITMTLDGQILGTPAYMSPEQARGRSHQANARSDVYSAGVILFQLLTGELPFRGDVRMLLHQVLHDEPPSPRKLNHQIPRDVETICLKCLEKDPARRYQSAAALAADLRRWLTGHPIEARPVSRTEQAWRWCHRNPAVASLSAAIVLVLLTGIAVSSGFAIQSAKDSKRANDKADDARRHLYFACMNLAQRDWEVPQVALVLDSLERTRPQPGETDLRGFEWHYWKRLCHSCLLNLKGHTSGVSCVAFSPDGKRLASASEDQTVKVWDATSGTESLTLKGHTSGVLSVAFSPDGKRLASASYDQTVKVWDATNGTESLTLKGHTGGVLSVAFSPDGKRLASASEDQTVKVWDATSGTESLTLKGHTEGLLSVAFSPDGKRLASASQDQTVKVWDATSGAESLTLNGHTGGVLSVAFSPDGKRLASASASWDRTVTVWDATSGAKTLTLKGHTGEISSVAFSPDGKRLASASWDQNVKVWDGTSGAESLTLKGHIGPISSVAFSPDGKRLASASEDQTVKVWDATSGAESLTLKGHTGPVWSVAFSPDGKRLASASWDQKVKVWDATSGAESLTLNGHTVMVQSVAFSPDGRRLASASHDQTVKVWDATSGAELHTLNAHTSVVYCVAFSPDGKRLASASHDETVKVWDATSGAESLTLKGHTSGVYCVAFSPDGKRLASASQDQTVKVWDATSGTESLTLKGHTGGVLSVAFSPDGKRLASASWDQTVKVWDVTSGAESLTLKGHAGAVLSVAFNPDGKRLVSASNDQMVKVWDTTSGAETLTLKGHIGTATNVVFSPDGNRLASATGDGIVKVWDARPWTPELRAEREALSLIHFLRDQGQPQSEWLNALSSDQTISEAVRQRAFQFAREWK